MNRYLWRTVKVLIGFSLVAMSILQLLGSQHRSVTPFRTSGQGRPVIHYNGAKFHDHLKGNSDIIAGDQPVIQKLSPASDGGAFSDVLLRAPRQKHDFTHAQSGGLWPSETNKATDRILNQMTYKLPDDPDRGQQQFRALKKILVYNGLRDGMKPGQQSFIDQKCPVNECELMTMSSRTESDAADLILWQDHLSKPRGKRPPGQIWMVFFLESPYHTPGFHAWKNQVNWTGTYRSDSTIVAPYERFTPYNHTVLTLPLAKNYALGKTKKVAWFVSNCGARNNRLGYAMELAKHTQVDIYGACGSLSCPRTSQECFNMLTTTYKFYLAFENSNCRDYITEKFFVNGLKNDVVPIVMGAHPDDYKRAAPPHSYIHVDDFESPSALAKYLDELDKDDAKYNEYFRWKGTGDNINTYFWCRLCAMLHAAKDAPPHVYRNLDDWWRGPSVCKELQTGQTWPKWLSATDP